MLEISLVFKQTAFFLRLEIVLTIVVCMVVFFICLGGLWLSFDGVMISYWRTPPNIDSSLSSDSAHPLYTIDSDCSFQCNSQSDGHYNSTPRNQRTLNIPGKHLKNYTTMLLVHTSWQKYLCTVRWLEIFQL